jgi:hypothetical protein
MDRESILLNKDDDQIETWAYVEIMGHSVIAGRVSERKVGVQVMLQIDVPKSDEGFAFSKLYSPSSIFSISPTTEDWCRKFQKQKINYPVLPYIPESRQLNGSQEHLIDEDNEENF